MAEIPRRPLTEDEQRILEYIRELYGDQNTEEQVFFSDNDEAAIFVTDDDGSMPLMVVLTNVARMQSEGNLSKEQVLQEDLIADGSDLVSFLKIRELKALPQGLRVTHAPNPAQAQTDQRSEFRYTWFYSTTVEPLNGPVVIEEFGVLDFLEDVWTLSNFSGDAYTKANFADWYSCPDGVLEPGSAYTDAANWFGRDELRPGENLWYFVGRDNRGTRVWGAATIELLGELDDGAQEDG